ncbi:MAG TPA: hypothetical protein PK544_09895 [Spirochaetota bacterium]|nr:hypothetical protein [Spirochaetota bacterium]HPJ37615.1 hypothetical protein [Spirochaetota bacterium]HPQ52935.1 hypothetical protein [Spirochaetota bacterium]
MEHDTSDKNLNDNKPDEHRVNNTLEENYHRAKADYYRHVLRKQDEDFISKIQKIPDDWNIFSEIRKNNNIIISDTQKKRLTDIKKRKSWELKFESLNIFFLINIEETVLSCLNYRHLSEEELAETIESANHITTEFGSNITNFKHLLLSLAKRSVSDLYYLIISFRKYYYKQGFIFEKDFISFCEDAIKIVNEYSKNMTSVSVFTETRDNYKMLFPKSSNTIGWKMDEIAVKKFFEDKEEPERYQIINHFKKRVSEAILFKKKLKIDHEYVKYYYNEHDGKVYRYNFITEALKIKLHENQIQQDVFDRFENIRNSFLDIKRDFDIKGILEFGPPGFTYIDTLEFIYKCCKIIEFFYLRSMKYESLQALRTETLYSIEHEYFSYKS